MTSKEIIARLELNIDQAVKDLAARPEGEATQAIFEMYLDARSDRGSFGYQLKIWSEMERDG